MRTYHKIILYWLFLHLLMASMAVLFLWEKDRPWLLAIEAFIALSMVGAVVLSRQLQRPISIIQEGFQLISENDLGTQFIPKEQAEVKTLVSTYNRIIEKLRQERQTHQEKEYFLEKIIDASETALLILDYEGRIGLVNPSAKKLLGHHLDFRGKKPDELPHPFGNALGSLALGKSEMIVLPSRKRVKCLKSEFFDRGFSREFITLDELTEELRQSELAAYEKLIRVISHEINNSLASVNSLLHTCLDYAPQIVAEDREDYETALNVMISRTDHLNTFMRNYADIIRLGKPQKRPSELSGLLQSIVSLFKSDFKKRGISLRWDLPPGEHWVNIDPMQFEQALVNIVKNAMEAIGEQKGEICLSIRNTKPHLVLLTISDTGCGISPEEKAQLFTPFFSTKENGQGIGLTFIQEVMHHHGFPFELEGTSGQPTKFSIWMS